MTNDDIKKYQKSLSDMKMIYVRKEEQKISLETQLNVAVQKLKNLGFEPDDIAEVLEKGEAEVNELEEKLKGCLIESNKILGV